MAKSTQQSFRVVARKIGRLSGEMNDPVRVGLRMIAEEIKTDVSASRPGRGVPRDEGILAASGHVEMRGSAKDPGAVISYGDASVDYALYQHERLDLHHDLGEARYLTRGVARWRPDGSAAMQALKENTDAAIKRASRA